MPTGYEVKMYQDISSIARSLERIAKVLEESQRPAPMTASGKKSAQDVTRQDSPSPG